MFLFISVIEAHTVIMNDTITVSLRPHYFGGVAWGGGGDGVFGASTGGSAVDINKNSLREEILN